MGGKTLLKNEYYKRLAAARLRPPLSGIRSPLRGSFSALRAEISLQQLHIAEGLRRSYNDSGIYLLPTNKFNLT